MKLKKILYGLTVAILALIFLVSAVYIGTYFYKGKKQQSEFDALAAMVENARKESSNSLPDPLPSEDTPDVPTAPTILREFRDTYALNSDLVGWIQIDGTRVNYPVVQSPEERDFYLHRNFNKESSERGCIYVREECNVFSPSDNVTIYGHHMLDGSMFHDLDLFMDRKFWEEHDTIQFDTLYEHHTYRIFAVFKTTATIGEGFAYHRFVNAMDDTDFDEFIATCRDLAFYDTGIIPKYGDHIICLSTCEYTLLNGRLVVAAVRVD